MSKFKVYFRFIFVVSILPMLAHISSCGSQEDPISISEILTTEISNVTLTSLTTGGTITAIPNAQITARGVVWGKSPNPVVESATATSDGTGAGLFQSKLTSLKLEKYYIRAYAVADNKTYYGNEIFFDHASIVPTLSTQGPSETTTNSANVQTTINYNWSDPIIEKGICWGTVAAPTIDKSNKIEVTDPALNFTVTLSNLNQSQVYFARAYAVTRVDVFYGNSIQVHILPPPIFGQVEDIDGNKYETVIVGSKTWMAENLAVTKYNDGTAITTLLTTSDFKNTNKDASTIYAGDNSNADSYGFLYNGYVINSNKNVCMKGWRVPTSDDWYELATTLGGMNTAGGKMKASSDLWQTPNVSATNESGFSGLPGGSYCSVCLSNTGTFADLGTDGYWWSEDDGNFFYLTNNSTALHTKNTAVSNDGLSIRCVKN